MAHTLGAASRSNVRLAFISTIFMSSRQQPQSVRETELLDREFHLSLTLLRHSGKRTYREILKEKPTVFINSINRAIGMIFGVKDLSYKEDEMGWAVACLG